MNYNTIGGKLRLIGLGNLHDLLNKVIDLNSPAAVRQQIRDLETQRGKVRKGVDDAVTEMRVANKKKRDSDDRLHVVTDTLQHIKDDTTHDMAYKVKAAGPFMQEKIGLERKLKDLGDLIATHSQTKAVLEEALTAIQGQIDDMNSRLERLESTEHTASAKEAAADALKNAREMLGSTDTSSVDSALSRAEKRNERAGVSLEREMENLKTTTNVMSRNVELDAAVADFLNDKPAAAAAQ